MTMVPVRFETLLERHHDEIYRYLWRLLNSAGRSDSAVEAQDISQEVFLRAYRAFGRLRRDSNYRAWLYKIALNGARSELGRKVHRTPHVSLDDGARDLADETSGERQLAARIDETQRARAVAEALDTLPGFMKEVVVLRCQQQLSFAEISRVTGAPVGTLKSRFHRAVAALRSRLAPPPQGEAP